MAERPILFSGAMVRAILDGHKTQTRRVIKRPKSMPGDYLLHPTKIMDRLRAWYSRAAGDVVGTVQPCPYGQPGDRLWVREAFTIPSDVTECTRHVAYRADACEEDGRLLWKPSIHMPRWASRILLEVTAIRVERLNDISEADAIAEGCRPDAGLHGDDDMGVHFTSETFDRHNGRIGSVPMPVVRYAVLWNSINGPGSWEANPWVWVVEFRRVMP